MVWVAAEVLKRRGRRLLDKQEGLGTIRSLPWDALERLVGEAYRRKGYAVQETGSAAGDGGVDVVLRREGRTVLVQCKQWRAWTVGVKPVRELLGVVAARKADGGIVVTCGRFTQAAAAFAEGNPIELVDGPALAALVAGVQAGAPSAKAGPKTAPPPAGQAGGPAAKASPKGPAAAADRADAPLCPKCGAKMVLRTAGKGAHQGKPFWGCSAYPTCRGIRDAG
jgi:restriction system protein